ncbi:GlsB/YeaQ/YmgE family stress response membrane protein, partial [Kitasatospora sp. NPDC048722]|uniref:GlsB/YeaQ/YmgE family stress response membrane protein n=1 Tax=Kitasatospora sp. NPDC048722 TaxID=3155639 RepID=UPI00340A97B2
QGDRAARPRERRADHRGGPSGPGQALLGTWGPSLAGMALIPSIVGAVIVVAVVSFFLSKMN